jgi:hypothetical protein
MSVVKIAPGSGAVKATDVRIALTSTTLVAMKVRRSLVVRRGFNLRVVNWGISFQEDLRIRSLENAEYEVIAR